MKKFFKQQLAAISALLLMTVPMAAPVVAAPAHEVQDENSQKSLCIGSGGTWNAGTNTCSKTGSKSFPAALASITNLLLFLIGAISVIMIIVGGIRYATSGGDQTAVTGAKNTILYSIIGLVVSFLAYAIVNFVVTAIK